jgi:hypothetical protein
MASCSPGLVMLLLREAYPFVGRLSGENAVRGCVECAAPPGAGPFYGTLCRQRTLWMH